METDISNGTAAEASLLSGMIMGAAGDTTVWKSLSLTHVVYPQGDLYGKCLGLSSLLPHAIVVAFFTLTLFVRDIHVISFFAGQVGNEALNFVLKRIVREGRPVQIAGQPNANDSFGWPSSHCQFQSFFFMYSTFCIVFRLLKNSDIPKWAIAGLFAGNCSALALVVHSRTYLRYHFAHQCLHGLLIGSVIAALWFVLVNTFIEPYILVPIMKSKLNAYLHLQSLYLPALQTDCLSTSAQRKQK